VVVGKNQNPWREAHTDQLESDGGKLARRITGGGTVYHDVNNLNFSFVMAKGCYNLSAQTKIIVDAVREFGIEAGVSGRNDILADGRKFSGNAFNFTMKNHLHHGTLLINTEITAMEKYLAPSQHKLKAKGVQSVRSRVVNLCELSPSINREVLTDALCRVFGEYFPNPKVLMGNGTGIGTVEWQELFKRNSSYDWRYGATYDFD